ncbi:acyl carrier protein [Paraflavitalea speifideaquila]|uniref:acyl carrier protein n=1 Tax=Paraflavitalea speifideaquila TaxID=3076558 RepID=UPI0028EDCCE7|nr:acyl carrier protein [Paraflavitalea speifideiaquila]
MLKENIFQLLIQHTRELFPELNNHAFLYQEEFRQFGASSIDRAVIIAATLEDLSLHIPSPNCLRCKDWPTW